VTLITSISGIRGTLGGKPGDGLTPEDIVKYATSYGWWVKQRGGEKVVIGRDARTSGQMVRNIVTGCLQALGLDVIDLGLSTTPTVELAVVKEEASGGIILTASHNPKQWNALKLLNEKGEFLSALEGEEILRIASSDEIEFANVDDIGDYFQKDFYIQSHIDQILDIPMVDRDAIAKAGFKIVIDCVNSTGGISVPELLRALGVDDIIELFCSPNGRFPHNPEPLPQNLSTLANEVVHHQADLGLVVDPDVDRLAIVCEDGEMFGEEYTLVSVADYVLSQKPGPTVSNLSSTRALRDVTEKHGQEYFASAVGEVNVVEKMKAVNSPIGGEGNGGIIFPELHYGRDALVGIALFLSHLAKSAVSCSRLRASYPNYFIAKNKIELNPNINIGETFERIREKYSKNPINDIDGLKIEFEDGDWVHLRPSNTEPIIRIYAESKSETTAENIARKIMQDIMDLSGS
jgi:phosphomannomutase